jgi:hypothetical protein
MVGEADEALHRPAQTRWERAVDVEMDGDVSEQRGLRGCNATRPEAALPGHNLPVARIGLANFGWVGEALSCHGKNFPRFAGIADPPLRRVLLFQGLVYRPRVIDAAPCLIARAIECCVITRTGAIGGRRAAV